MKLRIKFGRFLMRFAYWLLGKDAFVERFKIQPKSIEGPFRALASTIMSDENSQIAAFTRKLVTSKQTMEAFKLYQQEYPNALIGNFATLDVKERRKYMKRVIDKTAQPAIIGRLRK